MGCGDMYDLFKDLVTYRVVSDKILALLPDNPSEACSIISAIIDEYFLQHAINPITGWKILNAIADKVHDEFDKEDK